MLRLHLRKVPAEHEIGFLKKKLGSTQFREPLGSRIVLCAPFAPTRRASTLISPKGHDQTERLKKIKLLVRSW
jgi:hypothetical protein